MAASIAGLLILSVIFTGMITTFRSNLFGNVLVGNATKEAAQLLGERNRTEISINSITTGDGGCDLTVVLKDTGSTSMSDFSHMDVIVQFTEGMNAARRLTYTGDSGSPGQGEWASTLIATSDKFEPGIFNPGETMTVTAKLSLPKTGDRAGQVTIGTPNGIVATGSVSGLEAPC